MANLNFSRLTEISQMIASICSLIVASIAIWLTVQTRNDDVEYREASIRPRLSIRTDPLAGTMSIKNVGLGPASITSVTYRIGTNSTLEYRSDNPSENKAFAENLLKTQDNLIKILANDEYYMKIDRKVLPLELSAYFVSPDDIMAANTEEIIFEVKNMSAVKDYLTKIDKSDNFDNWVNSFGNSERGDFTVAYCSVTKKWCGQTRSQQ